MVASLAAECGGLWCGGGLAIHHRADRPFSGRPHLCDHRRAPQSHGDACDRRWACSFAACAAGGGARRRSAAANSDERRARRVRHTACAASTSRAAEILVNSALHRVAHRSAAHHSAAVRCSAAHHSAAIRRSAAVRCSAAVRRSAAHGRSRLAPWAGRYSDAMARQILQRRPLAGRAVCLPAGPATRGHLPEGRGAERVV